MKARRVLRSLVENEDDEVPSLQVQISDLLYEMPLELIPRGAEAFTDFMAELLNGGLADYAQSESSPEFKSVIGFLQQVNGNKAKELANLMMALDPQPDEIDYLKFKQPPSWKALEEWLNIYGWEYNNNREPLFAEVLRYLKELVHKKE